MSWFFTCWLWSNIFLLGQHCTFYIWVLNANLLQLYLPLAVAGNILWNRVWPSFPPDICLRVFLEFDHQISLDFAGVLDTLMNLCMTTWFFLKNFFCPKNWGNGPKTGFLALKKNLVINFHWICSIMNLFIIYCVPVQILYLEKM